MSSSLVWRTHRAAMIMLLGLVSVLSPPVVNVQAAADFVELQTILPDVNLGDVSWADYDGDSRLDVLLTGIDAHGIPTTQLYHNDGAGRFHRSSFLFPGVAASVIAWADYDNDGDLDLLLAGTTGKVSISKLYRNDGPRGFVDSGTVLPGVAFGAAAWADYDNDGDQDLLLTGYTPSGNIAKLYNNNHGILRDSKITLPGVAYGSVAWADYDGDGDQDLLIAGSTGTKGITKIYRNDLSAGLVDSGIALPQLVDGKASWGDYDGDHRLDVLLVGQSKPDVIDTIFFNEGAARFRQRSTALPLLTDPVIAVGDYDHNGTVDLALAGHNAEKGDIAGVYRNKGGQFTLTTGLPKLFNGAVAWGDYDGDRRLDLLQSGFYDDTAKQTSLFHNQTNRPNTPPPTPGALRAAVDGSSVTLMWNEAPNMGVTYNLRIGTTPDGSDVLSALATNDGTRLVVQPGNAGLQQSWNIRGLRPNTQYYWSVQAIDMAFVASPFATEGAFDTYTHRSLFLPQVLVAAP